MTPNELISILENLNPELKDKDILIQSGSELKFATNVEIYPIIKENALRPIESVKAIILNHQ